MASILKNLRLLADPSRLRILLLVEREELSVAELQEILGMGQSRISTHLAQLKQAGLVEDRRNGKSILYRLKHGVLSNGFSEMLGVLRQAAAEIPEAEQDIDALRLALRRRQDKMRSYFDELAGKFGRNYVPGRSWQGLARRSKKVIAIDNSEKMVEYGRELARKHGVKNLEYRMGDIEEVPIRDATVDLAFFSQALHHAQHPERAVKEASRILKPGGRIVVLDLLRHSYEEARELYADLWLGFTEVEVTRFLRQAGFKNIETSIVHSEEDAPHFETLLAVGDK